MKQCYECKEFKKLSEFYSNKARSDGVCSRCKSCDKIRNKKYREEHKEYFIQKNAKYYQDNKIEHGKYMKTLREKAMGKSNSGLTMSGIHYHIKQIKEKPEVCERCYKSKPLELASINHTYSLDPLEWNYLCRSCHIASDRK